MKPFALITRCVDPAVIDLLTSVCEVMPRWHSRQEITLLGGCADALLVATPERISDAFLRNCRRLRVVACAFTIPEHVDISACTRYGIWVTNVMMQYPGAEAEIEAARNILDVLAGDAPRGALNEAVQPAA